MLDFARSVRNLMDRLSSMTVMGVHVDWFFHMFGAAVIVILASRFLARRIVLWGTIALLIGKELFDVFAKTRAEYIRLAEALWRSVNGEGSTPQPLPDREIFELLGFD